MMGRSHVVLSSLVWLAAAPLGCKLAGHPLSNPEVVASTVVAGASALLPDWDHPTATMSRTLGPASKLIALGIRKLFGGHRRGTHNLFTCLGLGALTAALVLVPNHVGTVTLPRSWAVFALAGFLAYTLMLMFGLSVSKRSGLGDGIYLAQAAVLVAMAVWLIPGLWWWMPFAVTFGALMHCLEDMCTDGGLSAFLLPLARVRLHIPLSGVTGGFREAVIAAAGFVALLWVAYATVQGRVWWNITWLWAS